MSLRGAFAATWQSPVVRGDCFAIARNDMQMARLASLCELLSATEEELRLRRTMTLFEIANV